METLNLDNNNLRLIKDEYDKRCVLYRALGDLIKLYLYESLTSNKIPFSDIQYRIKNFHSFLSKVKRKEYFDTPYEKIEDICGVRVICTFKEDQEKITDLIDKIFFAQPPDNKESDINSRLSGYRGIHQIVQLKDDICSSHSFYAKLKGLRAEIQIRTIAQHSWSEISHKLNYKEDNVPSEFQNILSDISGSLSIIDRLYNDLRKEKQRLKEQLREKNVQNFDLSQEINIDTLTMFLNIFYSDRDDYDDIDLLFDELQKNNLSFNDIVKNQNKLGGEDIVEIEKEILGTGKHTQVGFVRLILSIFFYEYWQNRKKTLPLYPDGTKRITIIESWQNKYKNEIL